jgi:hypothetical protein
MFRRCAWRVPAASGAHEKDQQGDEDLHFLDFSFNRLEAVPGHRNTDLHLFTSRFSRAVPPHRCHAPPL